MRLSPAEATLRLILSASLAVCTMAGYTYHWGTCPKLNPHPDFSLEQFAGLWYVVYRTDLKSPCWTHQYVLGHGKSRVIQTRNQIVDVEDLEDSKAYAGLLEVPDTFVPGVMKVTYPDNHAGSLQYTVFDTDYINYGAILTCQQIFFGHRLSVTILSREPYLEQYYYYKIRAILMNTEVNVEDLKQVEHTHCLYKPPTKAPTKEIFHWAGFYG